MDGYYCIVEQKLSLTRKANRPLGFTFLGAQMFSWVSVWASNAAPQSFSRRLKQDNSQTGIKDAEKFLYTTVAKSYRKFSAYA